MNCTSRVLMVWPFLLKCLGAQFLSAGNRSLHSGAPVSLISRRVALWHVLTLLITLSLRRLSRFRSPVMRPPLHFQLGADASSPAGPRGGNARISSGRCRQQCLTHVWMDGGVHRCPNRRRCLRPSLQVLCQLHPEACNYALSSLVIGVLRAACL